MRPCCNVPTGCQGEPHLEETAACPWCAAAFGEKDEREQEIPSKLEEINENESSCREKLGEYMDTLSDAQKKTDALDEVQKLNRQARVHHMHG